MKKRVVVLAAALLATGGGAFAADSSEVPQLQKSCDGGEMLGCSSLGISYGNGEGVKQNHSKAKALFGKACDGGHQIGCDRYKQLNEQGY